MNLTAWRYKRFHVSYLLAWFGTSLLVGIFVGRDVASSDSALLLMSGLMLILGALRSRRWWAVGVVIVAGEVFVMPYSNAELKDVVTARSTAHTNTVEGYWSPRLKRSIDGTYHSVSPKYLQHYLNEFFRYNFRGVAVYPILLKQASKRVGLVS